MSTGRPPVWVVFQAHLRADPRKTALLAILALVMVGLYGRWLLGSKGLQPADAAATMTPVAIIGTGETTGVVVPPAVRLSRPLVRTIDHDPFAIDLEAYPRVAGSVVATAANATGGVAEIRGSAGALVLQSTLCGPSPAACVNGKVIRLGEEIEGFVVERIEPDRVVVSRENVRLTLWLK